MPTSTRRGAVGLSLLEQDRFPASYRPPMVLIGAWSYEAIGDELFGIGNTQFTSATYPAGNRALGYMFQIADSYVVQKVWWVNGTTATTDNADVGVYSEAGTTLLVSGGSTLIATANVVQEVDCTDTVLPAGRYWCVYNQNGVTATPSMTAVGIPILRSCGCAQFAGAVPLGASFTPAAIAGANFPIFGIAARTQVA